MLEDSNVCAASAYERAICACGHERKEHYQGTIYHMDVSGCNGKRVGFLLAPRNVNCGCNGFRERSK